MAKPRLIEIEIKCKYDRDFYKLASLIYTTINKNFYKNALVRIVKKEIEKK